MEIKKIRATMHTMNINMSDHIGCTANLLFSQPSNFLIECIIEIENILLVFKQKCLTRSHFIVPICHSYKITDQSDC